MPEYLATGLTPEGKKVTERVDADSADAAVRALRARGYDEVVLHTDDVGALYSKQKDVEGAVSPAQFLWFRAMPAPVAGFLIAATGLYRKRWLVTLLGSGALAIRRSRGTSWGFLDSLVLAYLLLPLAWAVAVQFLRGPAARYRELIDAVAWGRWQEVLAKADSVGGGVPPEEIAFRKAKALAGLGRLDEGLWVVRPFLDGGTMPAWLYWSRLAEVYRTGRRPADAEAAMAKAVELAPDNATVLIDAAKSEVWHRHDPRRARELMNRARSHTLSDLLAHFADYNDGLIALEEGRARDAEPLLERAYRGVHAFRHASPLVGSVLDQMHVPLGLAAAATGDLEAARRHFRQARPRLVALKLDEQIARCEKALGPHGVG